MSEMQRSFGQKIKVTKTTLAVTNRFRDKNKNQFLTLLNGVKTVALNSLTETTKSGNLSSTRQRINSSKAGQFYSPYSGQNLKLNSESSNLKLNYNGNNNSISSLRLNDKNLMFDLGNQMKTESFYSPLTRDRSNTINLKDGKLQKCKSSQSISSNDKGNGIQLKQAMKNQPNTPYKNIKLSPKKFDGVKTSKALFNADLSDFEENCKIYDRNLLSHMKMKGNSIIKNNIDVQKVRDAILGSIDDSNTEYNTHERRKLKFLNSLDENKDSDLLTNKFRYDYNIINISLESLTIKK
jgi:hypothetical protein